MDKPKHALMDEWLNKLRYICSMKNYLATEMKTNN